MRRSRPRSWGRISVTFARCWTNTSTGRASTGTSATAASTCGSNFDLETEGGIRKYAEFVNRAADLVVSYGGSLSGEHGDGQSRGALLPKMFGDELMGAFREFKAIWDPDNKLNPHKVIDAYLPTENLRLGADYAPRQPRTHFAFPDDGDR